MLNVNVAEQLPGGAQAMLAAVNKVLGKNLSMGEMKQMMKDGKLIAKEILPTLGDEMAKIARNGGALKEALLGLAVAESRMKTSFDNMLANIYQGGLSEGLKDLYTTLDDMFFLMSQGDSKVGKFLKGFIDGARESLIWVHDTLLDIYYLITEDLGVKGVNAEFLGKVTYWIAIAGAMNSVLGVMRMIFGGKMIEMMAAATARLLGFSAAVTTTATATGAAGAAGAGAGAAGGLLAGLKGMGSRIALAAGAYTLYDWFANPHTAEGLQSGVDQLGFGNKPKLNNAPIFQGGFIGGQPNFLQNANGYLQKQQVEMTLKVDATDGFRQLAKAEVETYGARVTQSILPTGWVSTSRE
ncbi:MAG: hypothetical protein EOM41_01190 [Bacilli bacterium]|nr:hypothetical protein [Bacilli bacterium]